MTASSPLKPEPKPELKPELTTAVSSPADTKLAQEVERLLLKTDTRLVVDRLVTDPRFTARATPMIRAAIEQVGVSLQERRQDIPDLKDLDGKLLEGPSYQGFYGREEDGGGKKRKELEAAKAVIDKSRIGIRGLVGKFNESQKVKTARDTVTRLTAEWASLDRALQASADASTAHEKVDQDARVLKAMEEKVTNGEALHTRPARRDLPGFGVKELPGVVKAVGDTIHASLLREVHGGTLDSGVAELLSKDLLPRGQLGHQKGTHPSLQQDKAIKEQEKERPPKHLAKGGRGNDTPRPRRGIGGR